MQVSFVCLFAIDISGLIIRFRVIPNHCLNFYNLIHIYNTCLNTDQENHHFVYILFHFAKKNFFSFGLYLVKQIFAFVF